MSKQTKKQLIEEFVQVREQMNELKRRERMIREFIMEDLGDKTKKTYGDITIFVTEAERERFDRESLHLSYPDIYEKYTSTYVSQAIRYSRKAS